MNFGELQHAVRQMVACDSLVLLLEEWVVRLTVTPTNGYFPQGIMVHG